ncbi:CNP1-like family protein [soil metagenome]
MTGFQVHRARQSGKSVVLALLIVVANLCSAQTSFDLEFDDQNKPWSEMQMQLPAAPVIDKLIPFYVSATSTQEFALDPASLVIGADGVIRYTIVATSSAGARNISHEGIRCKSYEKKVYAFGHADGSWVRARRDQWEPIRNNAANRQHASLAKDHFCYGEVIAAKADQILEKMRNAR